MWGKMNCWTTQLVVGSSSCTRSPPPPFDLTSLILCTFTQRWQPWNWLLPVGLFLWCVNGSLHKVWIKSEQIIPMIWSSKKLGGFKKFAHEIWRVWRANMEVSKDKWRIKKWPKRWSLYVQTKVLSLVDWGSKPR